MISFKMKILSFSSGSYAVEYIPDNKDCFPVKLNIKLDNDALENKDKVIEKLKSAAPLEYWNTQLANLGSSKPASVAQDLINTEHTVEIRNSEIRPTAPSAPANFMDMTSIPAQPSNFTNVTGINYPRPTVGQSTPEEVVNVSEQDVIKLKILIQQVLQEMAEGTV